jgi:hypothetical protein
MNVISELITKIPIAFWSAIIASILTLSGVLLSNYSNTKRLKLQLNHDSSQKQIDRTTVLRKEIYLKAVEELNNANNHLASLPQKDPSKENIADGLNGFFSTAAKLQLISEPETTILVNQLVSDYSHLMIRLISAVQPLYKIKIDITTNDTLYNQNLEQQYRVLTELTHLNESGARDDNKFKSLEKSHNFFTQQTNKYAKLREESWSSFNQKNIEFTKTLLTELKVISSKQIPVLIAIRSDLGLKTQIDELESQMMKNQEKTAALLDEFFQNIATG